MILFFVSSLTKILRQMNENPTGVQFSDLKKICAHYFGKPRRSSGSHRIFKTPWPSDPRVNIQNDKGKAKAYQVKQVLHAIQKLKTGNDI